MLHILNGVYSAADTKRAALLVGLDISAAFDIISHTYFTAESLRERLYGVRANLLKWIQSFVMERKQFVKLDGHTSVTSPCTATRLSSRAAAFHGLYVAPIGRVVESFGIGYHQFADDTQLFVTVDTADSADLTCVTDCSDAVRRDS